jgi:hypothetical protein
MASCSNSAPSPDRSAQQRVFCSTSSHVTSAAHIGDFLQARAASPAGPASGTFYAEQLGPIVRDRDAFYQGLERNGPRAGTEFARAEQIWAERARAARRSS